MENASWSVMCVMALHPATANSTANQFYVRPANFSTHSYNA